MDLKKLNKEQLIAKVTELTSSDSGATIAKLQEDNATLTEKLAAAESGRADNEEVAGLKQMVEELQAENAALSTTKGRKHPVVKLKQGFAQINVGAARTKKGLKTAAELAADPDLCQELFDKGSGAFTLVADINKN